MRRAILSLLVLVCLALPAHAAQPDLADIYGTWSGLDKSTVPKQLSTLVLTIEAVSPPVSPPVDEAIARRIAARARSVQPEAPEAQLIKGTLVSTVVPYDASGQAVTTTAEISGEYAPETGILRFWRLQGDRRYGLDVLGVVDEKASALAIIHTAESANQFPFVLYRGGEIAAALLSLADLDPLSLVSRSSQQASSAQQRDQRKDEQAQYRQELTALNAEISAAVQARDKELTARLRRQKKELTSERASTRGQGLTPAPSGSGGAAATTCPEHILAWANELDNNGASTAQFGDYIELSNLFRPTVFAPHFGKTFAEFTPAELKDLQAAVQGPCSHDGSALARGGTRIPLGYVLSGRPGYGVTEAGIAGIALELVAEWYERTSESFMSAGNLEEIESLQAQVELFLRTLWPIERNAARTELAIAIQEQSEQTINDQLDSISARIGAGEARAITDLSYLPRGGLFEKLHESRIDEMRTRYLQVVESSIRDYLAAFRERSDAIADPMEKLTTGVEWYRESSGGLTKFADKLVPMTAFLQWFGADREQAYRELKPQLFAEIEKISMRPAAMSYGYEFKLPFDAEYSPTWNEIDDKRLERLNELADAEYAARVGEGPFGVDNPGAILLNAIYRNDLEQIAEEDGRLHTAFMSLTKNINSEAPYLQLVNLLSGGSGSEAEALWAFQQQIRKSTMISSLMSFFAASYAYAYPNCLEDPVPFKKTTWSENVMTNGWGTEIQRYRSDITITDYNINRRHAAAFAKLIEAQDANPESLDFYNELGGGIVTDDLRVAVQFLSDSLRGLRQAMQENACDSEVMQRLDANMLRIYTEKSGQ